MWVQPSLLGLPRGCPGRPEPEVSKWWNCCRRPGFFVRPTGRAPTVTEVKPLSTLATLSRRMPLHAAPTHPPRTRSFPPAHPCRHECLCCGCPAPRARPAPVARTRTYGPRPWRTPGVIRPLGATVLFRSCGWFQAVHPATCCEGWWRCNLHLEEQTQGRTTMKGEEE